MGEDDWADAWCDMLADGVRGQIEHPAVQAWFRETEPVRKVCLKNLGLILVVVSDVSSS